MIGTVIRIYIPEQQISFQLDRHLVLDQSSSEMDEVSSHTHTSSRKSGM